MLIPLEIKYFLVYTLIEQKHKSAMICVSLFLSHLLAMSLFTVAILLSTVSSLSQWRRLYGILTLCLLVLCSLPFYEGKETRTIHFVRSRSRNCYPHSFHRTLRAMLFVVSRYISHLFIMQCVCPPYSVVAFFLAVL